MKCWTSFLVNTFQKSKTRLKFHHSINSRMSPLVKFRTNFEGYFGRLLTHRFSEPMQINMFIDGLRPHTRQLLDAFMGGKIKLETPEVVMELIGNMVASDETIHRDRTFIPAMKNLLAKQIEALTDKLNNLQQQLHVV